MNRSTIFLYVLLFLLFSCRKREVKPTVPILFTGNVVEVNKDGAVFAGSFKNIDPSKIVDFGFLWGTNKLPDLNNSLKHSLSFDPKQEIYHYSNNASLDINTTYYIRTYVQYGEKTYYGNIVSFYSLGSKSPVLHAIIPSTANFGDTVTITGEYIGVDTTKTKIFFNADSAKIIQHISDTALKVIVPFFSSRNNYFKTGKIDIILVKYNYNRSSLNDVFHLSPPKISSYSTSEGLSYNPILITGKGFLPTRTSLLVGNQQCIILSIDVNHIHALLPPSFNDYEGVLKVKVANDSTVSGKIKILAPKITGISPGKVFSYESMRLTGTNLENDSLNIFLDNRLAKKIRVSNDSIVVEVPGEICASEIPIDLRFGNFSSTFKNIPFKQPTNFEIITDPKNLFDGSYTVLADYMPEVSQNSQFPEVSVNGIQLGITLWGTFESYYTFQKNSKSEIVITIPPSVQPKDGWLNMTTEFCPSTKFTIDSVFHIPPPQIISVPDTIYPIKSYTITGKNFNSVSNQNKLYLGNDSVGTRQASNPGTLTLSNIPMNFPEGTYPLKVVTNGQASNSMNVKVVHRWHKVTDLPEQLGKGPITFFINNTIYVGGGANNASSFYAYDLNSGSWKNKSNLPATIGVCVNDSNYGYLVSTEGHVFRYDFSSDIWDTISSALTFRTFPTGFLYQNKIFIFQNAISTKHYYYDIALNTWKSYPGYSSYPQGPYTPQGCPVDGDQAYIFNGPDKFILNLSTLTFKGTYTTYGALYDYQASLNSFVYKGEAYFYNLYGWLIFNLSDFSSRKIAGPADGDYDHVYRVNNIAYVIDPWSIWKFNLDLQ